MSAGRFPAAPFWDCSCCCCSGSGPYRIGTCINRNEPLDELELRGDELAGHSTPWLPVGPIVVDTDAVKWVNDLLAELWPDMEKVAKTILDEAITPLIREKAPARFGLKDVHFSRFSLGKVTPRIEKLTCVHAEAFGGTRCHLFVEYDSDMNVELDAGYMVKLGVKSFKISGEAVMLIRPVIEEIHGCVGGCTFYFSNRPKIEMDFTGLANVADMGGISGIVRGIISQVLADKMVLPNAITQLVGYSNVDVYPLVLGPPHPPIGVLSVTTVKAEGIKSGDWHLWPSTAVDDNYIRFSMGDQDWKAPTAEMGKTHCFFVHDAIQRLSIDVWDEDQWSADDYLGKIGDWTAEEAEGRSDKLLQLHDPEQPNADAGHLQLKVAYFKTVANELPGDFEKCLIVTHFKELTLPSTEVTAHIAIRCQIGSLHEPKTTTSGHPIGCEKRRIARKILKDVAKRLQDEGVEEQVIERIMKIEGQEIEKDLVKVAINCHLNFVLSNSETLLSESLNMELTLIELPDPKAKDKKEIIIGTTSFPLQELFVNPLEGINKDIQITSQVGGKNGIYSLQVSALICSLQPAKPPSAAVVDSQDGTLEDPKRQGGKDHKGTDAKGAVLVRQPHVVCQTQSVFQIDNALHNVTSRRRQMVAL